MPVFTIRKYNPSIKSQILKLWELSVKATHHFLSIDDFEEIKSALTTFDFASLHVFYLRLNNTVSGFIGIRDKKVEMLFIHPDHFGKGYGKELLNFARTTFHISEVDVNEQNKEA